MNPFFIESLAQVDELVLTQFTVRSDEIGMHNQQAAEKTLAMGHKGYKLRFHYGLMEYQRREVSSKRFGELTVTADVRDRSFGGVLFGKPTKRVKSANQLSRNGFYAWCNGSQRALRMMFVYSDSRGHRFEIDNIDAQRLGLESRDLLLSDDAVRRQVFIRE